MALMTGSTAGARRIANYYLTIVERLIGPILREYLDRVFFLNAQDIEQKIGGSLQYYNHTRVHQSINGTHLLKLTADVNHYLQN